MIVALVGFFVSHDPVRIKWSCFFICFCSLYVSSQNLISNGGFDDKTKCPNRISQLRLTPGWSSSGSPDLFCTCSNPKSAVYAGLSFVGSLLPNSGECYCGFIVNPRYKEYLTYELPKKMKRRSTYCVSFLYARSLFSGIKVESLGVHLHRDKYRNELNGQPMRKKTCSVKIEDRPGVWTAISFTFTCRGGERFITFGSFDNDLQPAEYIPSKQNRKNTRIFNYASSAYYLIEDVSLVLLRDGETCLPVALPIDTVDVLPPLADEILVDTIYASSTFILQQLNFETAKYEILPSSFDELDELAEHLITQPQLSLTVTGHTDDRGNEKTNIELSEARARAVANYLISKGVSAERLSWKGLGQNLPIAENNSEEGRTKNRRVEFQFR